MSPIEINVNLRLSLDLENKTLARLIELLHATNKESHTENPTKKKSNRFWGKFDPKTATVAEIKAELEIAKKNHRPNKITALKNLLSRRREE